MSDRGDDRSKALRLRLAQVGIMLDDPPAPRAHARSPSAVEAPNPDEVRAILVAANAPPADLEWLVASCPSLEAARGYTAPVLRPIVREPELVPVPGCLECENNPPCARHHGTGEYMPPERPRGYPLAKRLREPDDTDR